MGKISRKKGRKVMSKELSTIEKRIAKNKELLVEQLRKIPIVQIACEKSNVSRSSYYRWKQEDSEFDRQTEEAISNGVAIINDMAESQLISSIKNGNLGGITYWLKHRHKAYSNKIEFEGHIKTSHELNEYQQKLLEKAINLAFGGEDE
jgi:hypothetical protein